MDTELAAPVSSYECPTSHSSCMFSMALRAVPASYDDVYKIQGGGRGAGLLRNEGFGMVSAILMWGEGRCTEG
jgi:hypothetical protein